MLSYYNESLLHQGTSSDALKSKQATANGPQEQHGCLFSLWLRCHGGEGPATQPSQQALRLQPIGFQLSVHFKGMLASLRASVHSFKSPAVGSARQTSHIFRADLQRDADGERGSPFTREVVQKHPVPLSYILFYTQTQRVQGAVGQSHFL